MFAGMCSGEAALFPYNLAVFLQSQKHPHQITILEH